MQIRKLKDEIIKNPSEYLLYLFVFLLPWQTRWIFQDANINGSIFEYGRMSLYAFDIVLIAILLYCYIAKLLKKTVINNQKLGKGLIITCLLFIAYCLFSVFWAKEQPLALYWGIRMLLGFVLFYLIQKINFSKVRLAIVVVMAGAIQGLLAAWQFLNQSVWQSKWLGMAGQTARDLGTSVVEFGLERWLRAYGSLSHPNILGSLLVLSFIGVVYLTTQIKDKYNKLFLIFSSGLIWLGILFSYSRSAWIAFILIYIVGIIYIWRKGSKFVKKFAKWLWLYGFVLLAVFVIATLPIVKARLNLDDSARLEAMSNIERMGSFEQAQDIIKDNLIAGTGIGNYTFKLQEKYPELNIWKIQAVHNIYLLTLAELGIIGILIILLLIWYLIRATYKYKGKLLKRTGTFALMTLCALILLFLFDHYWWTTATGIYILWLVFGLAVKDLAQSR